MALLSRAFCIVVDFQESAERGALDWAADSRERKRTLGAMSFLGELYQQGMVEAGSMQMMAAELLGVAEVAAAAAAQPAAPSSSAAAAAAAEAAPMSAEAPLELARELLLRGGAKLEASGACTSLWEILAALMTRLPLTKRLRFSLEELHAARAAGFPDGANISKHQLTPKTLSQIHEEAAKV